MNNSNVVVHYHGTPIWGNKGEVHQHAVSKAGAFVSYARPDQMKQSLKYANSVAIDNGAFSAWKRGLKINWVDFYTWLMHFYFHPKMDFFIIPDDIEGSEEVNNNLINSVPTMFKEKSVPVWHLHESLDKLDWLCSSFDRIALGSSGDYATIRTKAWHGRMIEAFVLIKEQNYKTKIHGLRMLDGRILGNYPLTSADSTNLACNIPKYKVKYPKIGSHILERIPFTQEDKNELLLHRCACLKGAIESVLPPTLIEWNVS